MYSSGPMNGEITFANIAIMLRSPIKANGRRRDAMNGSIYGEDNIFYISFARASEEKSMGLGAHVTL